MNRFLILAFLFFIGSTAGWVIELIFRRFCSPSNPERKWINPGFCVGPYIPLYGFGLCIMYLMVSLEKYRFIQDPCWNRVVLLFGIAVCLTLIEYLAGLLCLKYMNTRLWDYSGLWGNINGLICPLFSAIWAAAGAGYAFLIHPYILDALDWLSRNLAFSFVIGVFYGVFLIDVCYSANLLVKIRTFAARNHIIVRYEHLKSHIRSVQDKAKEKHHFFFPLHTHRPLGEWLKELYIEGSGFEKKRNSHTVIDRRSK